MYIYILYHRTIDIRGARNSWLVLASAGPISFRDGVLSEIKVCDLISTYMYL